ncbi:Hypothetical predicted protein [Olea europaea subsp. europaea]|uniref:GIR1-like zinc ribbon domain-containing protein n=1 Tax=Olea europaea subsp. europaea TaxID=158383 RepID=A0A8S0QGU6_OLEEU|nr:Hypothetical predicted protein [Olea europaea subsp. europaea]
MNYNADNPNLDLTLNLSPRRVYFHVESPNRSVSSPSSCLSREVSPDETLRSPDATAMMLVGCPRCLMYVMLLEKNPKCPKCKSTALLDFLREDRIRKSKK